MTEQKMIFRGSAPEKPAFCYEVKPEGKLKVTYTNRGQGFQFEQREPVIFSLTVQKDD